MTEADTKKLMDALEAKAKRDQAWTDVLATDAGKIVLAEILFRLHHNIPTTDPKKHLLQQVALEILRDARLLKFNPGSLPVEYVSMLTGTKLARDIDVAEPIATKPSLLGRILRRTQK